MLPFLKPKALAGNILSRRKPDGSTESEGMEGQEDDNSGLNAAAADLIRAVHSKDENAVAAALKAAFDICDSQDDQEPSNDESKENE